MGQGRLRGRRPGEVRPARPRDAHDAAPRGRPRPRARRRGGRSRHHPPGARGLRAAHRRRHHRRVPGGEPRADGHAAAPASRVLLRPRGGGRAHPARSHPGRLGASLSAAPQRRGARQLPAPAARGVPGEDPRRAAVPGAAHADGDRRRRLHARRVGPAAPGNGVEALTGADGGDARPALRGHGRARHHRRRRRRHRAARSKASPTSVSPRATR